MKVSFNSADDFIEELEALSRFCDEPDSEFEMPVVRCTSETMEGGDHTEVWLISTFSSDDGLLVELSYRCGYVNPALGNTYQEEFESLKQRVEATGAAFRKGRFEIG